MKSIKSSIYVFRREYPINGINYAECFQNYDDANKELLATKRRLLKTGYRLTRDEKKGSIFHSIDFSKMITEGENAGQYAYLYLTVASVPVY